MWKIVAFMVTALLLVTGCDEFIVAGSGDIATETRAVSDFNEIAISTQGRVTIIQGDTESFTITADDNLIPLIESEVNGSVLEISQQPNRVLDPTGRLEMEIRVRSLEAVRLSGAADIRLDPVTTDRLEVDLSGAGNIVLESVTADRLTVGLTGAGNIDINAGEVDVLDVALSGLGDFSGEDLRSREAQVSVSGAGNAVVWATETLDASISGAGNISYYGGATVDQNISGLGRVEDRGEK